MKHVISLADTDEGAQEVTRKLIEAGFAKEEIFVLSSGPENGGASSGPSEGEPSNEGTGLLAGIGPTIVGGTRRFMDSADRLMDPSSQAEMGGEKGNAEAFLDRFGVPEGLAQEYQEKLTGGGTLVAVRVHQQERVAVARKIFEEAHCQQISEA